MKKQIFTFSFLLFFSLGLFAQPKAVGEPRVVAKMSEPLQRPVWSPDGSKLLFTLSEDNEVWEVSGTGTNLRKSEAGAQLRANTFTNPLYLQMISNPMNVASNTEALKSLSGCILFNPVLSPQGDKIVFQASNGKGMYVCNADGSDLRSLSMKGERATWTPDGKYIVAMVEGNNGHFITKGELISINVATGAESALFSSDKYIAFSPAISPDGKKLAFEDYASGAIYVMNIQY